MRCTIYDIPCVYNERADGRRRHAIKEDLEKVEQQQIILEGILAAIRHCPPNQLDHVLSVIRSNVSITDIAKLIGDNDVPPSRGESLSSVESSDQSSREGTMRISHVIDQPIFKVPSRPWTSITYDDELVSHLVTLYFTWDHPFVQFLDRDLFLDDMRSGSTSFCSPFLVHAMLAQAAVRILPVHPSALLTASSTTPVGCPEMASRTAVN